MSDTPENPDPTPAEESADAPFTAEPAAVAPPTQSSGRGLALLALLVAFGALGLSGWSAWRWQTFQPPAEVELPDLDGMVQDRLAAQAEATRQSLDALRNELESRFATSESRLGERIRGEGDRAARRVDDLAAEMRRDQEGLERRMAAAEDGLARLAQHGMGSERALGVAEAEFLLRLGNERLMLFGDPDGALRALELADRQLQALDDPLYAGVRQALAAEIQSLASVDAPDRVALSGRLLQLAKDSPEWPLDARRSLQAEGSNLLVPDQAEEGWWARLKEVASNVVVVHREETDETVLLTLEEERLLRENVQLQLQVAQLAAVRGEQLLYAAAIGMVRDWLLRYYDQQSVLVTSAQSTLAELEAVQLEMELPPIDGALRRLRNLRAGETIEAAP